MAELLREDEVMIIGDGGRVLIGKKSSYHVHVCYCCVGRFLFGLLALAL
jgi:hypothetical protein